MSHLFYSQRSILLSFSSTPFRAIQSERNQQSYGKLFNLCSYRLLSDIISFNSNNLYRVIFVLQLSNFGQPIRLKQHQNTHDPYDDKLSKRVIVHAKRKKNPYKPKSFWQIYADNVRQFHKGLRHRNHYPNKKQPTHK